MANLFAGATNARSVATLKIASITLEITTFNIKNHVKKTMSSDSRIEKFPPPNEGAKIPTTK